MEGESGEQVGGELKRVTSSAGCFMDNLTDNFHIRRCLLLILIAMSSVSLVKLIFVKQRFARLILVMLKV